MAGFGFMRNYLNQIRHRVLVFLHLSPFSLAEKCRLVFGGAVVFILGLALLLPYVWMGQLTKKASLDAGRAKAETLMSNHFQTTVFICDFSCSYDFGAIDNPRKAFYD